MYILYLDVPIKSPSMHMQMHLRSIECIPGDIVSKYNKISKCKENLSICVEGRYSSSALITCYFCWIFLCRTSKEQCAHYQKKETTLQTQNLCHCNSSNTHYKFSTSMHIRNFFIDAIIFTQMHWKILNHYMFLGLDIYNRHIS